MSLSNIFTFYSTKKTVFLSIHHRNFPSNIDDLRFSFICLLFFLFRQTAICQKVQILQNKNFKRRKKFYFTYFTMGKKITKDFF